MAGVPEQDQWRDLGAAWNAVIEFSASLAVYGTLGWFADSWLHTGHVLFVVGLLLGMGLGLYILMKRADQWDRAVATARQTDRAAR